MTLYLAQLYYAGLDFTAISTVSEAHASRLVKRAVKQWSKRNELPISKDLARQIDDDTWTTTIETNQAYIDWNYKA